MILEVTTQNTDLIKAIKAMAKLTDAKVKTSHKKQSSKTPAWFKEAKNMDKNPQQYKTYTDIDAMFKDILQ